MTKRRINKEIWVASGLRTPFAKVGKELSKVSAMDLSVKVLNEMKRSQNINPELVIWGAVVPHLDYSNLGRETVLESELEDETVGIGTTMACSTSLAATIEAAMMLTEDEIAIAGGVESMTNVQLGLSQKTSNWMRSLSGTKGTLGKMKLLGGIFQFSLFIPPGVNRTTGKSMGEHAEITAQRLGIPRAVSYTHLTLPTNREV